MKKSNIYILLGACVILFACEAEKLEPVEIGELPTNVSFKDSIMPIFDISCNTSGCHNNGGIPPDLSHANAYNSLVYGNYVNTEVPEESGVYLRMIDDARPMPPEGINLKDAAYVLGWITEGAEDN